MSKKRFEIEKEQLEKYFAMHMTYKEIADIIALKKNKIP